MVTHKNCYWHSNPVIPFAHLNIYQLVHSIIFALQVLKKFDTMLVLTEIVAFFTWWSLTISERWFCICIKVHSGDCYRPQTKFAKVMFSQLSVCPQGWGCLPHCMLGYPPTLPQADTPWADTPPKCMLGYGQQVGGTHPTKMHSCLDRFLHLFLKDTVNCGKFANSKSCSCQEICLKLK